jgi:hypothetical protein
MNFWDRTPSPLCEIVRVEKKSFEALSRSLRRENFLPRAFLF